MEVLSKVQVEAVVATVDVTAVVLVVVDAPVVVRDVILAVVELIKILQYARLVIRFAKDV